MGLFPENWSLGFGQEIAGTAKDETLRRVIYAPDNQ